MMPTGLRLVCVAWETQRHREHGEEPASLGYLRASMFVFRETGERLGAENRKGDTAFLSSSVDLSHGFPASGEQTSDGQEYDGQQREHRQLG